jgi:hypothetical protein
MARPTKMTPETLKKLEDAYLCDATHLEAAIFAGISEVTLHAYRKENPEFSKRIDSLRGMIGLKAKNNIRESIESGDKHDSKWYLERRDKDFKPKSEIKNEITIDPATALINAIRDRKKERGVKDG